MASEIRVNKIENRSGLGTVTFADTGVDLAGIVTATTFSGSGASLTSLPAAQVTGTLPAISGANLTNLTAANLTGALPAISGANLTGIAATDNVRTGILDVAGVSTFRNTMNVGAAVTISESGIEASGIGITVANINGGAIGGRRNLILNGAMNIAQRGTSSTSTGYQTVDRFEPGWANLSTGGNVTISQQSLSSGSPYNEGFRKFLRMALPAAGTAAANSYAEAVIHRFEAQHIANSGWNYASSSSFVTLSFWFRVSTNQTFYALLRSEDGTSRSFSFPFTATGNDTWTKITKTIPGASGITVDNDNGRGFSLFLIPFYGTNYTTSGHTSNAWQSYSSSDIVPDMADTWLTAGASTFDVTGLQLEVGSQATAFEHLSIGEDLNLCKRYYQQYVNIAAVGYVPDNSSRSYTHAIIFPVEFRTAPTMTIANTGSSGSTYGQYVSDGDGTSHISSLLSTGSKSTHISASFNLTQDLTNFRGAYLQSQSNTSYQTTYYFTAEI